MIDILYAVSGNILNVVSKALVAYFVYFFGQGKVFKEIVEIVGCIVRQQEEDARTQEFVLLTILTRDSAETPCL